MSTVLITQSPAKPRGCGPGWLARLDAIACRVRDLLVGCMAAVLLMPAWALLLLASSCRLGNWQRIPRLGHGRRPYDELHFECAATAWLPHGVGRLPIVWNLLRGDIALVGPRPVAPYEPDIDAPAAAARFECRPGLVCLHWIRRRTNMAYEPEFAADAEYAGHRGFAIDAMIVLRALASLLLGQSGMATQRQIELLGLRVDNLSMTEAVWQIVDWLDQPGARHVCFVNADYANVAYGNAQYRSILAGAQLVLADGVGMRLAGRWLGRPIRENVNGTDLFPRLCAALEAREQGVFLLGGQPGVAEQVRNWIEQTYPGVNVVGLRHGYFTIGEERDIVDSIRASGARLLLVATGVPGQEAFIARQLAATGCRVAIGVGGLFDFYSGRRRRAPTWLRELGLEWFYRFLQEPGRLWRRYFVGNAMFLGRVLLGGRPLAPSQPAAD